jgi:trimeric autotransporter adhesin
MKTGILRSARDTAGPLACLLVMLLVVSVLAAKPAHAKTFTVDITADLTDADPDDGTCDVSSTILNFCSLRAAIEQANAYPGEDAIRFDIPGGGVQTIQPNSELPEITGRVTIDGYTQPGAKKNTLAQGSNAVLRVQLDGSNAEGTYVDGFVVTADNVVLRGLVINRFGYRGLLVYGDNSRIEGNFIGTGASGTMDLGNENAGVAFSTSSGHTVGGTTPAARNIISGNDDRGVYFSASSTNKVQGNYIGTDATGKEDVGNGDSGILIFLSSYNSVGGSDASSANIIAFNGSDGVSVDSGTGNHILRNFIDSNDVIGIDLVGGNETISGSTLNDPGDADTGSNALQNKPEVTSAETSGSKTTIEGKLNSRPNRTFIIRFFSNPPGPPPEGKRFIGRKSVTTNANGNVSFSFVPAAEVPNGRSITATATSANGNTSEFGVGPVCCS